MTARKARAPPAALSAISGLKHCFCTLYSQQEYKGLGAGSFHSHRESAAHAAAVQLGSSGWKCQVKSAA